MPFPPQPTQVKCPQCTQPFIASLHSIIDVGEEAQLKESLLRGRLNVVQCPFCGYKGILSAPLLYHDPDKELLLCLLPMEMGLKGPDQERIIGGLTNALLDALPPQKRRAYMLQPKTVLSFQRLVEEILLAEGITKEMLDDQVKKTRLIQDLQARVGDPEKLKELVEAERENLDYEFFLLLSASIDAARKDGDEVGVKGLTKLREQLLELIGAPRRIIPEPLAEGITGEEVIEKLLEAEDEAQLEGLIIANRPLLDYGFFQTLTDQIEAAQGKGDEERAQRLADLRSKVLDITDEVDKQARAAMQRAADLLRRILEDDDPRKMVQDHIEQIDETFLLVLSANIAHAREEKQEKVAQSLEGLYGYIISQLEERMPPEIKLINRLLATEEVGEREKILRGSSDLVNDRLLQLMEAIARDLERQGRGESAKLLREIRDQAAKVAAS